MPHIARFGLLLALSIGFTAAADSIGDNIQLGGAAEEKLMIVDGRYRSGLAMVEESLPAGYPAPTPPGAIELKYYPSVRRAEVSGDDRASTLDMSRAFFPLFRHIQQRDIAMTSPVEMDYALQDNGEQVDLGDGWTMSFLYRTADLGATTDDAGEGVRVVDTDPLLVISIGLRGPYGASTVERGRRALTSWLDNQEDWAPDYATFRSLSYNGPSIPNDRKWAEVQIGVKPRSDAARLQARLLRQGASSTSPAAPAVSEVTGESDTPTIMNARQFIGYTIERGAPMFNDGQIAGCIAVYEVALAALLDREDITIARPQRERILAALSQPLTSNAHDDRQRARAWRLRELLDAIHADN